MDSTYSSRLEVVLRYLLNEQGTEHTACHCKHHHDREWIFESDTWSQLEYLRRLLCQRPVSPGIPSEIQADIDIVIAYRNSHQIFTSTKSITPRATLENGPESSCVNLSCWKGDITALTDVSAIVNAANSQLLGCFRPEHRCIDNVIHTAAGPRLRDACYSLMQSQGCDEPTGSAKVTPGFLLPASWVLHTVGPQLNSGENPSSLHKKQLASCYTSCLNAAESLTPLPDGRKVVVFCCISTGLFAFPSELATQIAVNTVISWYTEHSKTTITDIIFDTFLDKDYTLYDETLSYQSRNLSITTPRHLPTNSQLSPQILKARNWLNSATHLIISAGAGLSAATGLDYTSPTLFTTHFPAFHSKGLRKLYDVFGYKNWDSDLQKWGYYFKHLDMVRSWPTSPLYANLLQLVSRFRKNYFVRTTNADGFFVKNGFDARRVATPQGSYRYLQCFRKCRPDAVFEAMDFVDRGLSFIDPVSQCLTDESFVPRCKYCQGEVTLCVRGGGYFNEGPFEEMEREYKGFIKGLQEMKGVDVVILELGVGLNTPGVLRWPNEDLVSESEGFKLIRVGMDASGCAPWELEEEGKAAGITGDIKAVLDALIS
ncbi:uncharacterized protein N7477_010052 [Penicillium maclennaniae]|uniref:uncharacterized protein n=1 Tax=Penicillium maclennaniae TaxID=1343394 RepID=UPI002541F07D|nr:uncharacterized protein N7477_010052 [Penicillium maclennaniae]KAJ5662436.1 hypothetical protein N7477_010052 [Penicillium maclennaniae]